MKTSVLKVFCSVFVILCLMSSCLGDNESSYSSSSEFTYIIQENNVKYAVTSAGYLTHPDINALIPGRCYFIAYKITTGSGSGVYKAEYVEVLDKGRPIASSSLIFGKPYSALPVNRNDTITPQSMQIGAWNPGTIYGDNWQIIYNVNLKDKEEVKPYFYFDIDGQKKDDGTPLDKNQIIIDVRFAYSDRNTATAPTVKEDLTAVGLLNQLRTKSDMFTPVYDSDKDYVNVAVKFRYQKNQGDKPALIDYIGSWTSASSIYFIQFTKGKN